MSSHRAGPLKQQNKSHKHGKHKSKSTLEGSFKGRIAPKIATARSSGEMSRKDRKNQMNQIRSRKRYEALMKKREIGREGSPPHLVVVVPLSQSVDAAAIGRLLWEACDGGCEGKVPIGEDVKGTPLSETVTTVLMSHLKHRFTIATPPMGNLYSVLDVSRVADTVLFVYDALRSSGVDSLGELCLSTTAAQGLPSTFHVVTGLNQLKGKKQQDARRLIGKSVEARFPKEKLHTLDTSQDASNVLRYISNQKRQSVFYRDSHAHILVEGMEFEEVEDGFGTLKASGYVRGRTLSVNGLIYLPKYGAFRMLQIDGPPDPHTLKGTRRQRPTDLDMVTEDTVGGVAMEEGTKVLEIADPAVQESLESEAVPDVMEGEQTWPTEDELQEAEELASQKVATKVKVPKGTSDYQAAWIAESGEESSEEEEEEQEDEGGPSPTEEDSEEEEEEEGEEDMDIIDTEMDKEDGSDTDKYDEQFDEDSERKQLELLRAAREEEMFPDEMDTPRDEPARARFAKYRGLQSFRHSPWDPREGLPADHAKVFHFENFQRTRKRALNCEEDQGTMPGWFVTVHIARVPRAFFEEWAARKEPLVLSSLLPHENKMSVIHFVLKMSNDFNQPIKSKERLIFQVGARRFSACPVFSQHSPGDKHKFERFFRPGVVTVASVYAPIAYPPSTVLVFNDDVTKGGHVVHTLVATGSVYKVDPYRVICKKIVLSGHPFRIHRKSATVRYLFFNREDILWFKPVELRTKYGRRGHIKEPLGTHGHMKCVFGSQLKAQDTVLMCLYKRVFPKWTYSLDVDTPDGWSTGSEITASAQQEQEVTDEEAVMKELFD